MADRKTKHNIIIGNAIETLKKLPENSIQLIVADPPYNIDIADWDSYLNYTKWAAEWINEAYRVLTKEGNMVIFGGFQFCDSNRGDLLELVHYIRTNTKFKLVNVIIWYYKNGMAARRFFSNRHEEIVWFAKTPKYFFDLDAVRIQYSPETLELYKRDKRLSHECLQKGKNPTNVWEISRLNSNSLERVGHKTQKPEAVIKRLVLSLCKKESIVFDLFSGSGITSKVCIETGRNSISCDIDPQLVEYFSGQNKRIKTSNEYAVYHNADINEWLSTINE